MAHAGGPVRVDGGTPGQATPARGYARLFENLVISHYESLDKVPDELDLSVVEGSGRASPEAAAN
jgi:hypothetical protein